MHSQHINILTRDYLCKDKASLLLCEGVEDGFFGTISGIPSEFGDQCIELPCSENTTVGIALSASLFGCYPILCFQRVEFVLLALEQLFNNTSTVRYLSRNELSFPVLFRFVIGRGWGQGPSHSQSLDSLLIQIPRINLFLPVFPEDSTYIFGSVKQSDLPLISLEHRWIHYSQNSGINVLSAAPYKIYNGDSITVVASSYNVLLCMRLRQVYQSFDIYIELINLLSPTSNDLSCIIDSINKTNLSLIIDLGSSQFSFSQALAYKLYSDRKVSSSATIKVIGNKSLHAPSSFRLIDDFYLSLSDIATSINDALNLSDKLSCAIIQICKDIESSCPPDQPNSEFLGPF